MACAGGSLPDSGFSQLINLITCQFFLEYIDVQAIHFTEYLLADKRKLHPAWRYNLRQSILPLIRWETPYLAWMQDKMRSPTLDSYFAITANLGTHTFFMVVLPILFWCGHTSLGRGYALHSTLRDHIG